MNKTVKLRVVQLTLFTFWYELWPSPSLQQR